MPPRSAVAGSTWRGSPTCSSDFFSPSASRTMPATIGKWRYEKESRASSLRSRPGAALWSRRSATSATTSK